MIKKIGQVLLPVLVVISITDWVIGVKKVNSESYVPVEYIELNEPYYYGDVCFTAKKLNLYSAEEFAEVFDIELSQLPDSGDMMIVAEFSVKNESGTEVDLTYMIGDVGWGFESHTWYSSTDPFECAAINRYDSAMVQNGEEITFYAVTDINKMSFSDEGWENLYDTEFYYTISIYPEPVKFKLGTPEKG